MGAKGSKSCNCCQPCEVKIGCITGGGVAAVDNVNFCCSCVPKRACVRIYSDADPYTPLAVEQCQLSCEGEYIGSLTCDGGTPIDYTISFLKDLYTNACEILLASTALGLTGDDRVRQPMGGEYADTTVKRRECRAMAFDFPVSLAGTGCGGGGTGFISISPGDYIGREPVPECGPGSDPDRCICDMACITFTDVDEYGEPIEKKTTACSTVNEYDQGEWAFNFDGGPRGRIIVAKEEPNPQFRLELDIPENPGDVDLPEPIEPVQDTCCHNNTYPAPSPEGCRMHAAWDSWDGEPYSQARIRIAGEPWNTCSDCNCWCRCLCVTFSTIDGLQSKEACWDEYESAWLVDFEDEDVGTVTVRLELVCDGCENPTTKILLSTSASTITTNPQGVVCPDLITGVWSLDLGGNKSASLRAECKSCEQECLSFIPTGCCYEDISPNLTATIEDVAECANLDGATVPLVYAESGGAWFGELTTDLDGQPCVTRFSMTCTQAGWQLFTEGGAVIATSTAATCSPFEIEFCPIGAVLAGCCDGNRVLASMCIRVTES